MIIVVVVFLAIFADPNVSGNVPIFKYWLTTTGVAPMVFWIVVVVVVFLAIFAD